MSNQAKFWIGLSTVLGLLAYANFSRGPEPKRWCPGTRTMETTSSCFLLTASPSELEDAVREDAEDRRNDSYRGR
jgi:hypothetical protein